MKKMFDKSNLQIVLSRINEVHCGILEIIKRYRNSLHSCGMTALAKVIAFTLAETLVVMGIIGVVAALTIPNLNQSTGDREKVAKLKKVYANLEDAFGRATAVYGPIDEWFINDSSIEGWNERFADRMTEFMKISKNCGADEEGCFSSEMYKGFSGSAANKVSPINIPQEPKYLLADGTAISFSIEDPNCSTDRGATSDSPTSKTCGIISVDIDGVKGSNVVAKDFFDFHVTKSGIYPYGGQADTYGYDSDTVSMTCFEKGLACTGWVIETGNMDYLKATDGKCPNGTTLSWENTSCK